MSKNTLPYRLLGERSKPPTFFYCHKTDVIDYCFLKISQQLPEGYLPQGWVYEPKKRGNPTPAMSVYGVIFRKG